jgi:hypothetical protein
MNTDELGHFLDQLEQMRKEGKEEEAKALIRALMQELPEEVQDKILFSMFVDGLQKETDGLEVVRNLQGQGLAAADALEKQKKEHEK